MNNVLERNGGTVEVEVEVDGMGDAIERLRVMKDEYGLEIIQDLSINDGDILYNPNIRTVIIGDYIKEKNIDVLLSML